MEAWQLIAILGAVIVLFSWMQPKRNDMGPNGGWLKEMETTLEQFSMELEAGNEKVMEQVAQMKQQYEDQIHTLRGKVEMMEQQLNAVQQSVRLEMKEMLHEQQLKLEDWKSRQSTVVPVRDKDADAPKAVPSESGSSKEDESSIATRYKDLLELYEQGKSLEHISKKFGIHKGEAQLIVTLAREEKLNRVQK
ncbi:DUF6115 domain-containing protein [Marinicrinis lubricantis]|uniref:DUF6115 domain-containing protein n=1 Tax=Marinicrinis lubricantis TaxID=2086470 RepID=A0ABW1IMB8_9BACL